MLKRTVTYFNQHRVAAALVIFSLSFGIRFTLLLHYRDKITTVGEGPRIAYALITKGEFADPYIVPTGPTAHTTPFFPFLLAAVYKVFGFTFAGQFVRCLVIIGGYSILYGLYPALASAFGFPYQAGLVAGFFAALLPVKRSFEVFRAWEEPWAALSLAALLILTLRRYQAPRRDLGSAILLGIGWGLALYVSFSLASILAGLLVVDVVRNRSLRVLVDGCIVLLMAAVVMSPWLLRNHRQLHGWTLMRDNLGLELRFSNRDHSHAAAEVNGADPLSDGFHPSLSVPQALLVREMGELNYNKQQMHFALAWIASHPRGFAVLTIERFLYFWLGPAEHKFELLFTSFYTLMGFAGIRYMRERVGEIQVRLWYTVLFFYPLLYYCVQYIPRYRVQIDWMIWLSAGLFVCIMLEKKLPFLRDLEAGQKP
ncbi:MAG: hypothetical protein ACLP6G_22670 [Terriglobales bacterium]